MSTQLAPIPPAPPIAPPQAQAGNIEKALVVGDLSALNAQQRLDYYMAVCNSLKLNPLTKPFAYLQLNGKTVLYALKDCTEQLRTIHNISVQIVGREIAEDVYVVTARAIRQDGRCDESIGAVSIGAAKGEARANAIMKAETKAKRRVTLSICGLGMLDESEVSTIPGAQVELPPDIPKTAAPFGTQAAADEIASKKLAELKAPEPTPAEPPKVTGDLIDFMKAARVAKDTIGEKAYYQILRDTYGFEHANLVTDAKIREEILEHWRRIARSLPKDPPELKAYISRMTDLNTSRAVISELAENLREKIGTDPANSIMGAIIAQYGLAQGRPTIKRCQEAVRDLWARVQAEPAKYEATDDDVDLPPSGGKLFDTDVKHRDD